METEIKKLTDEQLLTMLANSTKTYYSCGGHTKANGNERLRNDYKKELEIRGVSTPDDKELLKVGVFNGEGSW